MVESAEATSKIFKRGFGLKPLVQGELTEDYHSRLIEGIIQRDYSLAVGDLTFRLAKAFGFCYGVDRSVDYAYEARKQFPNKALYLTAEIIHNPRVNRRLMEMGVQFLSGPYQGVKRVEDLTSDDVVIIAAFGTSVEELAKIQKQGCTLVDTTCGSVVNVWKRVERYAGDGYTAIIHGSYKHEETQATASRVTQYHNGQYLIVWDKAETRQVCDYIVRGGDKQRFMEVFGKCLSAGFDPDRDLVRIGCANQTTMLSSESSEIAEMLRQAMAQRYGEAALDQHFRNFDTICSATQERQDAVLELIKEPLDLMVVIGGFNSSNTNHLCEITSKIVPTYHIDEVPCLLSRDQIRHKPFGQKETVVTDRWLPDGAVRVGITAGASTPDRVIGEAVTRILTLRGHAVPDEVLAPTPSASS